MTEAAIAPQDAPPARGEICPHLGLRHDPSTAASYVQADHVCWHPTKPAPIHPDIQARVCLAGRYPRCPVYRGLEQRPPRPPWRLPRVERRQAIAGIVFAVLVPAVIGALAAILSNDDSPSGAASVSARTGPGQTDLLGTSDQPSGLAPSGNVATEGEDLPDGSGAAGEDETSTGDSAAANGTPLEQLRGWTDLIDWEVQAGDSLAAIAREFDTTIEALAVYNDLADINTIFVGQALVIPVGFGLPLGSDLLSDDALSTPQPGQVIEFSDEALAELRAWTDLVEWEVQDGDSLFAIATDFGTTVEAIAAYNEIDQDAVLPVGTTVTVPVGFTTPLMVGADAGVEPGVEPEPEPDASDQSAPPDGT